MTPSRNQLPSSKGYGERFRNVFPVALTLCCGALFCFLSGGYIFTRSAPIAIAYLLIGAVWLWFLRGEARPPLLFLTGLAAFGLFVAWVGLSVLWSFGPDLSWIAFDIAAFYLVVAAVVGLTPVRGFQLRASGYGFLALATAVGVYAFLGKGLPDVVKHAYRFARLDSPIGYWNALALFMVMGMAVALAFAGDRHAHPAVRALAAAAAVPMAFTFFFTLSRGGWVVLAVALVVYFAFTTSRLASLVSLVAVAAPVAGVLWRVRGLDTLFAATTDAALRTLQGHVLFREALVAVAVAAGAQLIAALVQRLVPWPRWSRVMAGAVVLAVLVAGVAAGSWRYLEPRGGFGYVEERVAVAMGDSDTRSSTDELGRLMSLNTGRPTLWRSALEQSRVTRLEGAGAGTFAFTHLRFREQGGVVRHAHSQWLNVLSELGVVGLVLIVAALALLLASCIRNPFADRGDRLRPLVVALQACAIAFVVHLCWDWAWDMAAIGTVAFFFIAVCASYLATRAAEPLERREAAVVVRESAEAGGAADESAETAAAVENAGSADETLAVSRRAAPRAARWPLRVAGSAALVLLAVSWMLPYLAARAEDEAVAAAGVGDTASALQQARRAARLDPLAVDPLMTQALVLQSMGRDREALAVLRDAVALQPDNYQVYYEQGRLQLRAFGRRRAAVAALRRSLALNPLDTKSRAELEAALGK